MSTFAVNPDELTRVAGTISPAAATVSAAGGEVRTTGVSVGLGQLDSVLGELASSLGGWLTQAGKNIETLAYNTQLAGAVYARAEADNVKESSPAPSSSDNCPPNCVA